MSLQVPSLHTSQSIGISGVSCQLEEREYGTRKEARKNLHQFTDLLADQPSPGSGENHGPILLEVHLR